MEKLRRKFSYAHKFWLIRIANEVFFAREKKWYVQSNLTEVCEFGAKISPFFGVCRLQRARY